MPQLNQQDFRGFEDVLFYLRLQSKPPADAGTLSRQQTKFYRYPAPLSAGIRRVDIRPFRGKKVLGAIYEVSEECLKQLDRYEGSDYRRLNVIVNNEDGEPVEAVTYIRSKQAEEAKPSPEYLAIIQQGYKDWRLVWLHSVEAIDSPKE